MFTKTRLPLYYFGDDINQDDKLTRNNDSISLGINSIVEDVCASEPNLSRIPSPASSLASTKKLEWDSGADIGYNNAYNSFKKSRRSKSFPSLNMDLSISQINKSEEGQGDEISIENKVADDINKEISSTNSQSTNLSKLTESKKKTNFTHSTPYEAKMVSRSSKSSFKSSVTCQTESANKNIDECLQTTMVKNCSKSVQTDTISLNDDQKVNKSLQTDTIKSHSSSSGSSLSKSSSFQYISCANTERPNAVESKLTQKVESKESCKLSISSKSKSESSNSSKPSTVESISSNTSPLAKMIATQQSTHLISDIDKSLTILQKFIQSKNYTPDTKKFYARKIVNKIIASKYSEDSSSTSLSTNKSSEQLIEPNILLKIANSKDVNDFSSEGTVTPQKSSRGVQCDPVQKNVATETDKNKKLIKRLEEMITKNEMITEKSKDKNKSDIDLSNKNWKEAETLSEKLFEARRKSIPSSQGSMNTVAGIKDIDESNKGDYIIQHSKKERKRQLSWINNEISYLHRLKELLQKPDTSSNASPDLEIKNVPHAHSRNHSEKSQSTITNKSSFSDVENRFYEEFGSGSSNTSEKRETLKKLSKLLTNDQIKYLIDNDSKKEHQSCECCKSKETSQKVSENKTSKTEYKTYDCPSKSECKTYVCPSKDTKSEYKTYVCPSQATKTDCLSHEEKNNSFNSHSYKFYDNLINSGNASQPVCPTEQQTKMFSLKSDAGIQCTLKKKKRPPQIPTDDSTRSTDYSNDVQVFYKNTSKFNHSDSPSTEYGKIEDSVPYFHFKKPHSPKKGKENYYRQRKPKQRPRHEKPIAYFLTFEEESMSDFYQDTFRKSALENVTVKVPKLPKSAPQPKPNPPVFRKPKPAKPKPAETEDQNKNENTERKPIETVTYRVPKSLDHTQYTNKRKDNNTRKPKETVTYRVPKSPTTAHKTGTIVESDLKTLQDYLLTNRPDYVKIADWRRSIISDQTDQNRRSRSIFTCAEMRKQTIKKFNKLPEVQNKIHRLKVLDQKRHNRCMAHVFGKKLQKKTLKGELSIATCMNVMSADSL